MGGEITHSNFFHRGKEAMDEYLETKSITIQMPMEMMQKMQMMSMNNH